MKTSHAAYNELFVNIFSRALQNICRIINTISPIWRKNVSGYLSLDIILSSMLTVFLKLRFLKTVRILEQIMSADKYRFIFFAK